MLKDAQVRSLEWYRRQALSEQPPPHTSFMSVIGRDTNFPKEFASKGKGSGVLTSPQAFVHEERDGRRGEGHTDDVITPFDRS